MDHDLHRFVQIVVVGNLFFGEFDAAQAHVAIHDDERDGLDHFIHARSRDAHTRFYVEFGLVPAATQSLTVLAEESSVADVEPGALVRADVYIAHALIVFGPNDENRKGSRFSFIRDARQAEGRCLAALQTVERANDVETHIALHAKIPVVVYPLPRRRIALESGTFGAR